MQNVIIAFAKETDAANFKKVLMRKGIDVSAICTSGAQALEAMENLGNGVLVCGYRLSDMLCEELSEYIPSYFQMVVVASPARLDGIELAGNAMTLATPLQGDVLASTITMMLGELYNRRKKLKEKKKAGRSPKEQETINKAKELLMERHNMTEPQAHKYLQKCSMDSGTGIVEAAEMVISLNSV